MNGKFWSPLYLGDEVGPLNNIGDDLTVNPRSLLNPNRGPMLIDQFRFSSDSVIGQADFPNPVLPYVIAAEIKLGAVPLMSSPVTLGAFVPRYVGLYGTINYDDLLSAINPRADSILVWHLAKPLFVPQDVQVSVRLVRQRLYAIGTQANPTDTLPKVRVSIVGRSLPQDTPTPDQIWVPWVSETKAQVASSQFVSKDSELINNHDTPLHIKNFCAVNANTELVDSIPLPNRASMFVQMTASNGTMIVRDPTPFSLLFPQDRNLLELDAMLQPGEFFRARLEIPSVPTGAPTNALQVQFTAIGMTGYRQVRTPKPNR